MHKFGDNIIDWLKPFIFILINETLFQEVYCVRRIGFKNESTIKRADKDI